AVLGCTCRRNPSCDQPVDERGDRLRLGPRAGRRAGPRRRDGRSLAVGGARPAGIRTPAAGATRPSTSWHDTNRPSHSGLETKSNGRGASPMGRALILVESLAALILVVALVAAWTARWRNGLARWGAPLAVVLLVAVPMGLSVYGLSLLYRLG